MTFSEQTVRDLTQITDTLAQRVHELTADADAINATDPVETASLADLHDRASSLLESIRGLT